MKKSTLPPLLLIDAMNLVFRSHFTHPLTYEEKPVGAIYGFLKKLHSLRVKLKTDRVVVCWDYGHPGTNAVRKSWRARAWEGYKAGRTPNPETARALEQTAVIHRAVGIMGFWNFAVPGLEADDLIGMASGAENGFCGGCYVFSGDSDLYQLLDENTVLLQPTPRGADKTMTPERVLEETGVSVDLWAEFLAFGGDKSDGIRPIPNFGPKKAALALQNSMRPSKAWKQHRHSTVAAFSKKYPAVEALWSRVNEAYRIVVLPRHITPTLEEAARHSVYKYLLDEKLEYALQLYAEPSRNGWPRWGTPNCVPPTDATRKFASFCSDYGFDEFLSKRHAMMK